MFLTKKNLLPTIHHYMPSNPTIVEAGAFTGTDTLSLHNYWPHATIHAFEPVPEIFVELQTRTEHISAIHRYPYALSSTNGSATFYISESPKYPHKPSQAGSLLSPQERLHYSAIQYPYTITVPTITLDTWAEKSQIDHIDLLWLDTQGAEYHILQAAPYMLSKLQILYTEVHFTQAYQDQPLYNTVKSWLLEQGFSLIGTDFKDESSWFFGNALFVRC